MRSHFRALTCPKHGQQTSRLWKDTLERMVNELIIGNKSTLSTIFHAKAYITFLLTRTRWRSLGILSVHGIKRHQMAFHSKTTTARSLDFAAYLTKCDSRWQHCGSAQIELRRTQPFLPILAEALLLPHKFFLYLDELAQPRAYRGNTTGISMKCRLIMH